VMSNMYDGVKTVNELGGRCLHECKYCSTHSLRKRYVACERKYGGEYRLWESELKKGLGVNNEVFVCGQNDLFEAGVPSLMIEAILRRNSERSQSNRYMIQSKNPMRMLGFVGSFPQNSFLGTTIETDNGLLAQKHSDAPPIFNRVAGLSAMSDFFPVYVTIEPIMDFDVNEMVSIILMIMPKKVYIGADSKGNNLPEPCEEKVVALVKQLSVFTTVEVKGNLLRIAPNIEVGVQ